MPKISFKTPFPYYIGGIILSAGYIVYYNLFLSAYMQQFIITYHTIKVLAAIPLLYFSASALATDVICTKALLVIKQVFKRCLLMASAVFMVVYYLSVLSLFFANKSFYFTLVASSNPILFAVAGVSLAFGLQSKNKV